MRSNKCLIICYSKSPTSWHHSLVSQPAAQPRSCRPTSRTFSSGLYPAVPLSTQQRSPHPPSSSPLSQLSTQPSSTVLPACSHLSPTQQPSLNHLAAQLLSSTLLPPSSPILSHPAAQPSSTKRLPTRSATLSHQAAQRSPTL